MMAEEEEDGSLSQELEVLQSIYLEELEVCRKDRLMLRITIHPTTGDDPETQYVRMTLQISVPPQYPGDPPEISATNPRGLGDEQIESIISALRATASQSVGCPILYALIEKGKELLTACNLPRGHCVICLYEFQEDDSLTKTRCFHHFHSYCLGRYVAHCLDSSRGEEPVECPVCRESLNCDLKKLLAAAPPQQPEELYVPDSLTLRRDKELRRVYERQLANGGIIDLEAEKNRFFISIQETPTTDHEDQEAEQTHQTSADQTDPGAKPRPGPDLLPLVPKPHVDERTYLYGHRPLSSDHSTGQVWRGGRGWRAGGRRRPNAYREDDSTRGRAMIPASVDQELQAIRLPVNETDPGAQPRPGPDLPPLVSKPHVDGRMHQYGNRALSSDLHNGQPWRGSRGWRARGRRRPDARRFWREDDQTTARGRAMERSSWSNGTVLSPPGGKPDL